MTTWQGFNTSRQEFMAARLNFTTSWQDFRITRLATNIAWLGFMTTWQKFTTARLTHGIGGMSFTSPRLADGTTENSGAGNQLDFARF